MGTKGAKRGGLIKKTIAFTVDGERWGLTAYYSLEDAVLGRLSRPRSDAAICGILAAQGLASAFWMQPAQSARSRNVVMADDDAPAGTSADADSWRNPARVSADRFAPLALPAAVDAAPAFAASPVHAAPPFAAPPFAALPFAAPPLAAPDFALPDFALPDFALPVPAAPVFDLPVPAPLALAPPAPVPAAPGPFAPAAAAPPVLVGDLQDFGSSVAGIAPFPAGNPMGFFPAPALGAPAGGFIGYPTPPTLYAPAGNPMGVTRPSAFGTAAGRFADYPSPKSLDVAAGNLGGVSWPPAFGAPVGDVLAAPLGDGFAAPMGDGLDAMACALRAAQIILETRCGPEIWEVGSEDGDFVMDDG